MIRSTSQEAYNDIFESLGHRQRQVFDKLKAIEPARNKKIALELSMPINEITPRINELRYKGMVKEAFKAEYDGRKVIFWETVAPEIKKIIKENPIQETLIDVTPLKPRRIYD